MMFTIQETDDEAIMVAKYLENLRHTKVLQTDGQLATIQNFWDEAGNYEPKQELRCCAIGVFHISTEDADIDLLMSGENSRIITPWMPQIIPLANIVDWNDEDFLGFTFIADMIEERIDKQEEFDMPLIEYIELINGSYEI